ncbi:MAG: hypothetical protein JSR82_11165 [Verrucomicrobia bacterium]|nr:hypothetical protein [Verrucomicrobiota bacterium]
MHLALRGIFAVNTALLVALAVGVFLAPVWTLLQALRDPGLRSGAIPEFARTHHERLAPGFERWARQRVAAKRAAQLGVHEIAATEWPVFSCVFFLWATEALEREWRAQAQPAGVAPSVRARGAIEAAADLLIDPNHAHWVKLHWGDAYLERENLFYRMLLIAGLTSYQRLTGDRRHESLLRQQTTGLAGELEASPHGLVDDYPGQCYPIDVLAAVAAIRRAGELLGIDYTSFVERAKRGFLPAERLDASVGLPGYIANSRSGQALDYARGVGQSFMLVWAAELWPDVATDWYRRYERHFWEQGAWVSGFREWAHGSSQAEWQVEVDAGPVIAGFGTAASGFGLAAARACGRAEHAFPLALEALAAGWPTAFGPLLGARTVSGLVDAPHIGESVILFALTRTPLAVVAPTRAAVDPRVPPIVWAACSLYALLGLSLLWAAWIRWRREAPYLGEATAPRGQAIAWAILTLGGLTALSTVGVLLGAPFLLAAQLLPRPRG